MSGIFGNSKKKKTEQELLDEEFLASQLRKGLDEEQFEVWVQPQVNHAKKGALIGAEALVRWRHPERGLISPAVFIPLLEKNGMIYELDKYVWKRACSYIRKALDDGIKNPVPLSVNVSRHDIIQKDFINTITSIVNEKHIPFDLIHLEVTESAFSDDSGQVAAVVRELIRRKFIVAIDDFGSGYSSLSLLRSVPAHIVKLDMRFFADGEDKTRNTCIVESIIKMVKMLGMSVIAEGIEQVEQANLLSSIGCAYIQGYLYSKPLPYKDFVEYNRSVKSERNEVGSSKAVKVDEKAIETQKVFHSIVAGTGDVVIVSDNKTKKLLYANHAAEQYFGKRFDPINPVTCNEYCNHRNLCNKCPAFNMKPNERRDRFVTENGKRLKITFTQMDWNGHNAVVQYQTDITEQMKEYEFSNALIQNMPGATFAFELTSEGRPQVRYVSNKAMRTFEKAGIERAPTYDDFVNILHPEDTDHIKSALIDLFLDKKAFQESFRIMLANGESIWIETFINPVADRDGSYLFYGLCNDITYRKTTQDHIDSVLQSIPAAITIYESSASGGNRVFISDRAKEVLLIEAERHERRSVETLYTRVHKEDREMVREAVQKNFGEGKAFSIQFRIVSETGVERWLQLDAQPFEKEKNDGTRLFYCIYTDISGQKHLELNVGTSDDRNIIEGAIHFGLQEAAKLPNSSLSLDYIIRFVGKVLRGERAYIFEMNPDGTNSNTYEWVADGIVPEKDNLQNLPEELSKPWYDEFKKDNNIIINDLEEIKESSPDLYEALYVQNIHSLIIAPIFNDRGKPIGFFGIDNPPKELLNRNIEIVQTAAYYIEAIIKTKSYKKRFTK